MTGDRIFGAVMVLVAVGYILSATTIQTPFFPDPVGPKIFPMMIAGGVIVCALSMILRPDPEADWPATGALLRIALAVVVMVAYAQLLKPLGFLIPTALAAGIISYMLLPRAVPAMLTGAGLSLGLYLLFRYALKLETLRAVPRDWLG
jgi:putative tricarboxylic transport membrane protein